MEELTIFIMLSILGMIILGWLFGIIIVSLDNQAITEQCNLIKLNETDAKIEKYSQIGITFKICYVLADNNKYVPLDVYRALNGD